MSVICANDLETQKISLEVIDQPADIVLSYVARRMAADLSRTGSLYYLGDLRPEDVGIFVYRSRRLDSEDISAAVRVVQSDVGQIQAFPDGLVVVADRVQVLGRVADMLAAIEATDSVTWAVQIHIVSLSRAAMRDLGIDSVPALDVGLGYAAGSAGAVAQLNAGLEMVLHATREDGNGEVIADPFFLLLDGTPGTLSRGKRFPVALRSTSDQGTTTTREYQFVDVGLDVEATVRELSATQARLRLRVELSQVESVNADGVPVSSSERIQSEADVISGGCYLLSSLERTEQRTTSMKGLGIGRTTSQDDGVMQVWARVFRVGGDTNAAADET